MEQQNVEKYFNGLTAMDEIRAAYKLLVEAHHPNMNAPEDREANTTLMQEINGAYALAMAEADKVENPERAASFYKDNADVAARLAAAIEFAVGLPNVEVELCGQWLWLGGDTRAVKEDLKANGFRWSHNKVQWYFAGVRSFNRKRSFSKDDIRARYGSKFLSKEA